MKSRRNKTLTDEQAAVWAAIIGVKKKKQREPKKQLTFADLPPTPVEKYMDNCLWWIKEYKEGRATQERAKKAARALIEHCNTIIKETTLNNL